MGNPFKKLWSLRSNAAFALVALVLVAPSEPPVGVVVHAATPAAVQQMQRLGVKHARTTLYWALYKTDAAYRGRFRQEIGNLTAAGIEPLVVVHQAPDGSYAARRQTYRDFAAFMAARVRDFPSVRYWQLFNEADAGFAGANLFGHSVLSLYEQGAEYARMLRVVAPAMRAAGPVEIVANPVATDGREWARGVIGAGGDAYIDVWSIHAYGFPVIHAVQTRGRALREVIGSDARLFLTEWGTNSEQIAPGWDATPATVDRYHLEAMRDGVEWNDREGVYERMYWYVLGGHHDFQLVDDEGTFRPAAKWLRERNRARRF